MKIRAVIPPSCLSIAPVIRLVSLLSAVALCSQCKNVGVPQGNGTDCVVSVKDQKLGFYRGGQLVRKYPISTSKFGLSDKPGTYGTPLGVHEVVAKIGHGYPVGAVFHSRQWTGEVIKPDSPGRDPIVTRIMWLRGLEQQNRNAYGRCIYIHGTAEERNIGKPVSFGCIRMKSQDVVELFANTSIGTHVLIQEGKLPSSVRPASTGSQPPASSQPPLMLNPEHAPGDAAQTGSGAAVAQATPPAGAQVLYTHSGGMQGPAISLRAKKKAEPKEQPKAQAKEDDKPKPKGKPKSKSKSKAKNKGKAD